MITLPQINIFQLYIGHTHVLSVFAVGASMLLGILICKQHPPHIRMMISMITTLLGHFVYEDIFMLIMGMTGRSASAWVLYTLVMVGIVAGCSILNTFYPFIRLRYGYRYSLLLLGVLMLCFTGMWFTGWFHALQLWYLKTGPDPHNWLWAMSKVVGFVVFFPMLSGEET